MNEFSIKFISDSYSEPDSGEIYQYGEIVIDDFQEKFLSSLSFWSVEDYRKHWIRSLKELYTNSKSGLIIDMYDPEQSKTIEWWILYKVDTLVYFQNSLLFLDELNGVLEINRIAAHIPTRERYTDEGELISEWCTSITSIEKFIMNYSDAKS